MKAIVDKKEIHLAILGLVDGNGHPYSWSAIVNGYDKKAMENCPFPAIPQYLGRQPPGTFGIPGAKITHIWTDDAGEAPKIASASKIAHVVARPEDVIGEVDAVIIATDKGFEHADRCRPFVEAGLPVFVDKPLTDNLEDLRTFIGWERAGAAILSSSSMRYCKEFAPYRGGNTYDLGKLRYASVSMAKTWERYGIHALEGIFAVTGPGYCSVRNTGSGKRNIVHLKHKSEIDVVIAVIDELTGAFGVTELGGTQGNVRLKANDSFYAFKAQLQAYVSYLQTGIPPFPFDETVEMMKIIVAGTMSREQGGCEIILDDLEV